MLPFSRTSSGGSVRPSSARPSSSVRPASSVRPSSSAKTPLGSEIPESEVRSRPSSAGSDRESMASSISSTFPGGSRMDALLKALYHERQAGGFFQKYIERSGNKVFIYDTCAKANDSFTKKITYGKTFVYLTYCLSCLCI